MKRRLLILVVFAVLLAVEALWLLPHSSAAQTPAPPRPGQPQQAAPVPEQYAPITDPQAHSRPAAAHPSAPDPIPAEWYAAQPAAPDAAVQRIPPSVLADSGDESYEPSVSADGRYTAFHSYADNLVANDLDGMPDVFVYDRQTGQTELVSVDANGVNVYGYFYAPSISDDGRYVAFYGYSTDLVPGTTDWLSHVYVRDRQTGAVSLVSVKSNGAQGNNNSYYPAVSANGQFVVFASYASNLVTGDTNNTADIFLCNRSTGVTSRVSLKAANTQANDSSWSPTVSADGRYVAFYSYATNLVTGDTNNTSDIFVRDVTAKTTARASVSSTGAQANEFSEMPEISDNGRYVTFTSWANNLIAADTNSNNDVFVRDRQTNTTTLVSRDAAGNQAEWGYGSSMSADGALVAFESPSGLLPGGAANSYDIYVRNWQTGTIVRASVSNGGVGGNGESWWPALSSDGTAVAFQSVATNLIAGDNNLTIDIFVRKLSQSQTNLATGDAFAFTEPNKQSHNGALSLDGRYAAFISYASNLVPGDYNNGVDVFVTDRQTGATTLVSAAYWGGIVWGVNSEAPNISDNGRYVVFSGYGEYFVENDTNGTYDIFVRDRQINTTERVSVNSAGDESNGQSWEPSLSADGNLVAFSSYADNLVSDDSNGYSDIFVHNRATGVTTRVSVASNGAEGNDNSYSAYIAAGGRYVVFESYADNLAPDDFNGTEDIFLHDMQTGQTELISHAPDGSSGDDYSIGTVVSGDGRYVAFLSGASNLVPGDTGYPEDVFLYDRQTGAMTLVTIGYDGGPANGNSDQLDISNDGRYISFTSYAENLVFGDTNYTDDVFVYDRVAGTIARASVNSAGQEGNDYSFASALSGDGSKIAFTSYADNLIANDTYGFEDVFVTDRPVGSIPPDPHDVYFISPSGTGNVGGIAFTGADILRYTRSSNSWQMVYDGSVRGTVKNIAAFDQNWWGSWLLVFGANQVIPGLGTATPRDIVLFIPNNASSYPLGAGTYDWYLRGADIGLTTSAENIDALQLDSNGVYISTAGAASVGPGNSIKAQDEDVLLCVRNGITCDWQATLVLDGSTIPGMTPEDVGGLSIGPMNGNYYVTLPGAFNVGGVKGNGKSILSLRPDGGSWIVKNVDWLAPGMTFPSNLDGLSLFNPYP